MPFLETISVAWVGALIFSWVGIPLPWMLGPLAFVMVWQLTTKRRLHVPANLRDAGMIVFGYLLATSVTRETVVLVGHHLPSMLVATLVTVMLSMMTGYWMARWTGNHVLSSVFGFVPGGLTQMVLLSEEVPEVDATIVAFMQTTRLIAVIFIVPFLTVHGLVGEAGAGGGASALPPTLPALAEVSPLTLLLFLTVTLGGAWLGKKVRLPAATLTGPLLAVAAVILLGVRPPQVPAPLMLVSQLVIGAHIGLQMRPQKLQNLKKLTLTTIFTSVLLVAFAMLTASLLVWWNGDMSFVTAFLAAAPGGVAEMGITASIVHADVSLVTGYQLFRIFFIIFAVPYLLRWWLGRRARTHRPSPGTDE